MTAADLLTEPAPGADEVLDGPFGPRPVVFVGPFEHHSNLLPWRESAAEVVGIKPGWVRLSFNYFVSDREADYLIEAVDLVATYGHRLLGEYRFDPRSEQWRHRRAAADPELSLDDLLEGLPPAPRLGEEALAGHLREARAVLDALPPELERLRDFHLPPLPAPAG